MITAGSLSLILGIIGIVLPLLPTTPFLLLSAYLFTGSSERLYRWLTDHRVFGNYILCYRKYRAISKRTLVFNLILLWGLIGFSVLFVLTELWLQLLLAGIAIGVTVHLTSLNSLTPEMLIHCRDEEPADHQQNS
ncbi:MAG: YbaN family protein [Spirochaetia bacterium]|nr:YbaN family protein [Spirochaetia bacterium]